MRQIILVLLMLAIPVLPLLSPLTAAALTDQECRQRYGGKSFADGSQRLETFNNSDCAFVNDGVCLSSAGTNGRSYKITCYKNLEAAKKAQASKTKTGGGQTAAGNVSASCADDNDICVKDLPRGTADSGFVRTALNVVIGILAAVSVLFVAIGGMRYIFSQGDPQAVSKAKSTIVYALIGLAVVLAAQGIVTLVLKAVS